MTVLLLVSPVQTIASVKENLLHALNDRGIKEINGDPVPESVSKIELGVRVDSNDLEKGWKKLEVPAQAAKDGDKKRVVGGRKSVLNLTLQGAGLKDSQTVAFRFRETADDDKKDELEVQLDDPGWDVIVPTLSDDEVDSDTETVTGL